MRRINEATPSALRSLSARSARASRLLVAFSLAIAVAFGGSGLSASEPAAERIDAYQLSESLPEDKTSDYLRQSLVIHPLAPTPQERAEGAVFTYDPGQLIAVSVRPNVRGRADAASALAAVASLPELQQAHIVANMTRVFGYVRADELAVLATHPAVSSIDRQKRPVFSRSGSTAPSTMLPNRIAEIRNIVDEFNALEGNESSQLSLSGEGLKIGVISDGIAGALWFGAEAGESFDVDNCDPDADTSFTVVRNNPILPIGYADTEEGDVPLRLAREFLDSLDGTDSPTAYVQATAFGFNTYAKVGSSDISFVTFNTNFISGSYPFDLSSPSFGNGDPMFNELDECEQTGDPDFVDDRYMELASLGLLDINEDVMRVITDDSGLLANEGTAVIDIIRDYVPDAEFYFANAFDFTGFTRAVNSLHADVGCDIIYSDLSFFDGGPYDGDSNSAAVVLNAAATENNADGIRPSLVITAAGNLGRRHHRSNASDSDGDGLHAYSGGDETLRVRVDPGETLGVHLAWDERYINPAATYDQASINIELFLLDPSDPSLSRPLAVSRNPQDGLPGAIPTETILINNNTGVSQNTDVVITLPAGTPSTLPLDLFFFAFEGDGIEVREYLTPAGSILQGPDARHAITIGQLDTDPTRFNKVAATSSRGPISNPIADDILKPEFVSFSNIENGTDNLFVLNSNANLPESGFTTGPDFVDLNNFLTTLPNNSPLTGTSGAAADATGMIALYLSYLDSQESSKRGSSSDIRDAVVQGLGAGAYDLVDPGPDNTAGFGRINPYGAIYAELLDRNPLVNRYFYADFNTLAEKQIFTPQSQENLGFDAAVLGSTSDVEPNALTLAADRNVFTWGYFFSNTIVFNDGNSTLDPSKYYRVRVRVSEDFGILPTPIFRVRAQARNSSVIHTHVMNDNAFDGSDGYVRERAGGTTYTHYFQPSPSAAAAGMEINLDIISADPSFALNQALLVQEVEILELNEL